MTLMHYQNREWITFNWPMPVDFKMAGHKQNNAGTQNRFKSLPTWAASFLPKQLTGLELGAGFLPDNDQGPEIN